MVDNTHSASEVQSAVGEGSPGSDLLGDGGAGATVPLEPYIPGGLTIAAGFAWRLLLLAGFVVGAFAALSYFSQVTVPVGVALLITAMLYPLTQRMINRWRWNAFASAGASLVVMFLIVAVLLTLVGTQVASQWPALVTQFSAGFRALVDWFATLPLGIDQAQLDEWVATGLNWVESQATALAGAAASVGTAFGHFFAGLGIALFAAFFFAAQGRQIFAGGLQVLIPQRYQQRADQASQRGWDSLVAYMRAAVVVAGIDAIGVAGIATLLGVPLGMALFALTWIVCLIPIVGAIIAGTVAVSLALISQGWVAAVIMLVGTIAVMMIESHFLQPLVMGKAVDIHPLAILLGITAGGIISGILGALLAIPVLAFGVAFVRALRRPVEAPADEASPESGAGTPEEESPGQSADG
ncbi:MAG: AI-2E family transporter [Propioniciclava sp.]